MTDKIHFIPVGFDFERLIHPISQGGMEADRVVLITHHRNSDKIDNEDEKHREVALATNITDRLEETFELMGITVEVREIEIENLYEYEELYPMAYSYILDELEEENEVFVNISSMPRTVAFAFATAVDSMIAEYQGELEEIREYLHTYYVAPQQYLVLDMLDEIEKTVDFLNSLVMEEDLRVHERLHSLQDLLNKVERTGITEGARTLDDEMFVEFPASPGRDVDELEQEILYFLHSREPMPSTSELAKQLAKETGEEYDSSIRSRVQYNVAKLEEKGYVRRKQAGNRLETELSTMGRMWVETH